MRVSFEQVDLLAVPLNDLNLACNGISLKINTDRNANCSSEQSRRAGQINQRIGAFKHVRHLRLGEPEDSSIYSGPVSPTILQAERRHEFGHMVDRVLAVARIGTGGLTVAFFLQRIIRPAPSILDVVNVAPQPSEAFKKMQDLP